MSKMTRLKKILFVNCFLAQILCASDPALGMDADTNPFVLQENILRVAASVRQARQTPGSLESVIVIGHTGSGKSTLITYLAGRPLVAKDGGAGNTLDTDFQLPGFKIGHGTAVGTRVPSFWRDETAGVTYWDCPGFEDPRGSGQEVINAFSVHELFSPPSRIKLVLVADEGSILTIRGRNFLSLLKRVSGIFRNQDDLKRSLSLVVTHKNRLNTSTYWSTLLSQPIEENPDLGDNNVRGVLEFLADNATTRVSALPYAKTLGAYDIAHRAEIQAAIDSSLYVDDPVVDVRVGLRAKSLMSELEESANGWISGYVRDVISSEINTVCEGSITGHEKTGRALKADFAEMFSKLKEVRYESQQGFVADLTAILKNQRIDTLMGPIQDRISCLGFFEVITGSVTYRADQWKFALNDIIVRLDGLAQAREVKLRERNDQKYLRMRNVQIGTEPHYVRRIWGMERHGERGIYGDRPVYRVEELVSTHFPLGLYMSSWPATGHSLEDWMDTDREYTRL